MDDKKLLAALVGLNKSMDKLENTVRLLDKTIDTHIPEAMFTKEEMDMGYASVCDNIGKL